MAKEEEIPQRSSLWLDQRSSVTISGKLFDPITNVFFIVLIFFSFIAFWPIISVIEFKAAFATPAVPFLISVFKTFGVADQQAVRIIFVFAAVSLKGWRMSIRVCPRHIAVVKLENSPVCYFDILNV